MGLGHNLHNASLVQNFCEKAINYVFLSKKCEKSNIIFFLFMFYTMRLYRTCVSEKQTLVYQKHVVPRNQRLFYNLITYGYTKRIEGIEVAMRVFYQFL